MKRIYVFIGIFLFFTTSASGWDTKEYEDKGVGERQKWLSIYHCINTSNQDNCPRNEHELLSEIALSMASRAHSWHIGSRTDFTAYDLNASIFRSELRELLTYPPSSNDNFPLERRQLPAAPHFAGIPDFSYTIYDWINKNELCPSHPVNDPQLDYCHVYALWHGAGLNSSHFGTQASKSYLTLHATALDLAAVAAAMLNATISEDERKAHMLAIREAELLALAYESYAQHFLSDRWAMGHMWDRWGAPEYNAGAYGDEMGSAVVTGLFTGFIHGYEAVTEQNIPDAMSSPEWQQHPLFKTWSLYTPEWRFADSEDTYDGVGDYRLQDMQDGLFGAEYAVRGYTDFQLNVTHQQNWMLTCLAASYGEVIRGFGTHPNGGYGIDGVELTTDGSLGVAENCLSPWATNKSIETGWGVEGDLLAVSGLGDIARYAPALKTEASIDELGAESILSEILNSAVDRAALVSITASINLRAFISPDGIDLAQGNIGPYGDAQQAGAYPIASYFEPVDLTTLPKSDPRGRDIESIYGLFNRAGAGYFCAAPDDYVQQYRGSTDDTERAACRLLAQRMYSTTHDGYAGAQAETQSIHFNHDRTQVRPLCEIAAGWTPPSLNTDETPYKLHPGYVPWAAAVTRISSNSTWIEDGQNYSMAYEPDEWGLSTQSIAAWCDGVPVIDTVDIPEDAARDIVARVKESTDSLTLTGLNFGTQQGRVLIGALGSETVEITNIESWNNTEITLVIGEQFSDIQFDENRESYIFLERAIIDGQPDVGLASLGRFVLIDEVPRPKVTHIALSRGRVLFFEYTRPEDIAEDTDPFGDDLPPAIEDEAFRPINAGPVQVEIEFDRPMDKDPDFTTVRIGDDLVSGEWISNTKWRGNFELLNGDFYVRRVGFHPLHIDAKAENGGKIDTDPTNPGAQPNTEHQVLIDIVPIYVTKIEVKSGRDTLYGAQWIGGPDLATEPNISSNVLNDPHRALSVSDRIAPPPTGDGEISLKLSAAVRDAPIVVIGSVTIEMTGEGDAWTGKFDYAAIAVGMIDGKIQIEISSLDDAQKGLDGDPRTVTQINRGYVYEDNWLRYESGRGQQSWWQGGTDNWHFLAAPVDLSFVIILDASGSMGDDTGRMEMAKSGIAQTLDQLPEDVAIEVGAVVFSNCGNIATYPFTRDIEALRSYLNGVSPDGATPLALALKAAGELFDSSADPAAAEWRYATFTDGEETCDGNVAGAAQDLNAKTEEHRAALDNRPPEEPNEPEPLAAIPCNPASWRSYKVETISASPFDTIRLVEYWYLERALPDGQCYARLQTKTYGVYYGSGPAASVRWRVNSRPSATDSELGMSLRGLAHIDRVRVLAAAIKNGTTGLDAANAEISRLVQQALE